jgi:flavin-dependent dehydrogenase
METEYDVIIIGSGPAGSSAARSLTQYGLDTLILEKETLPRYKCCSGVLFGEAQELLQTYFGKLPPEEVYCRPKIINASNIQVYKKGKGFSQWYWEWPKNDKVFPTDYLNIWRDRFDHWLALESGATIIDGCPLKAFEMEEDKVTVFSGKAGKERTFLGKYLIGADGGNSKVRDILDPEFKKSYQELTVNQVYHEYESLGIDPNKWYLFDVPELGDVNGSVHVKDDLLTLCAGSMDGRNIKSHIENFITLLEKKFHTKVGRFVRQEGCVINTMFVTGNFHQGNGRVLLTGEAAGLLHMNGSGIDTAIDSGYRAGEAVAEGLKNGVDAWQIYYDRTKDIRDHIRECARHQQMFT